MAITYVKLFEPVQLGAAVITAFTVPGPSSTLLRGGRVRLTNTSSAAVSATVYAVPLSGAAADSNALLKSKAIAANDFLDIDLPVMKSGDFLQAMASTAAALTLHAISGSFYA